MVLCSSVVLSFVRVRVFAENVNEEDEIGLA